ncbi:hypothetical protein [Amycolatopsis sp. H20-H5]|nr:hypothetical protein [Amycolatopsis sp. H20-H5]MEC3975900.1 hypothetical protein [Amycolatopsis sp. H20-H5]
MPGRARSHSSRPSLGAALAMLAMGRFVLRGPVTVAATPAAITVS